MRQVFAETMSELAAVDENLVVVVGDISHGIFKGFAEKFPNRYYNIGILEPTMVSLGAGLSSIGFHPVLHTIAPFMLERAYEQIKLDFCYNSLGGNLVTVGSAFDYSNLGCTHHCYSDFALIKSLGVAEIYFPCSSEEFKILFKSTYANKNLSVFRLPGKTHGIEFPPEAIIPGVPIVARSGHDLSVIVTGPQLGVVMQIAQRLASEGVEIEVIYVHSIRPLNTAVISASLVKTRSVLVIEEHSPVGGLTEDVLKCAVQLDRVNCSQISIPPGFIRNYGTYDELLAVCGLDEKSIESKIRHQLAL
jgi:transketolase